MLARAPLAALASLALAACPPAPGDPTATGATAPDTAADTTASPASSTAATTSTTSTTSTASTSTTADTTTTTSTTTTGGPPESVCDPQPEVVRADFIVDDDAAPDFEGILYKHHCTVAKLDQGLFLTIELADCKADPGDPLEQPVAHTIAAEIFPQDPIDLAVGDPVVFSYAVVSPWWSDRAFTLRRPSDELVLAGLKGEGLPGGPGFFAPLALEMFSDCPTEPLVEPDSGCDFIACQPCYLPQRATMRFAWAGGATIEVIDRSAQTWPDEPYWLVAGDLEFRDDINCSDTPGSWARLMLLRFKP